MEGVKLRFFTMILGALAGCAATGGTAVAEPDASGRVADLGTMKVAIYKKTESKDGRYAAGWTIECVDKKAEPVDWSLLNIGQPWDFLERYGLGNGEDAKSRYAFTNGVVDLRQKKFLEMRAEYPEAPLTTHGDIAVWWGPMTNGRGYGFVVFVGKFDTPNLLLVSTGPDGMKATELAPALTKAAMRVVRDKRPRDGGAFDEGVNFGTPGDILFHGGFADVPFEAEIPKQYERGDVKGTVTVRLADGAVMKARSDTKRDDPFEYNAELKEADAELNAVYGKLLRTLGADDAKLLKEEQRDWIAQRDSDARDAADFAEGDYISTRDKSLLDSTQKRAAELKQRLAAAQGH